MTNDATDAWSCSPVHEVRHVAWESRPVVLVCGPPGSGKSTFAATLADRVIEVEDFADADSVRSQLRLFGRAVHRLGRNPNPSPTVVVRCAASAAEREHHEQMCRPSRTVVLLTPAGECHRRIDARGRDRAAGEHRAVDEWWSTWRSENADS